METQGIKVKFPKKISKYFDYSEIICTFAPLEPAKPLNDAQMCGSFYILSVMTDEIILICYYPILPGHLIGLFLYIYWVNFSEVFSEVFSEIFSEMVLAVIVGSKERSSSITYCLSASSFTTPFTTSFPTLALLSSLGSRTMTLNAVTRLTLNSAAVLWFSFNAILAVVQQ